jgi:hypothetical protein
VTTRHFCTYFDHNYLPRGMVMLETLYEHCPQARVHVLCLSDACRAAMEELRYPHVSLLPLADLEKADPELEAVRPARGRIDYYFTITPCLPWHLLKGRGVEEITYLDADMMFFSSPQPLFAEAGKASVIITPHKFPPHLEALHKWGLYNVSWMTFRNTAAGLECLSWYRKACLEWCFDVLEENRFADQKYLDDFPVKFSGVHCMRHPGGGVAPWNVDRVKITKRHDNIYIDNLPLIFYHAQGVKRIIGPLYSSGLLPYTTKPGQRALAYILQPYIRRYAKARQTASRLLPASDFSGIRPGKSLYPEWLRTLKRVLMEARHGMLVWA